MRARVLPVGILVAAVAAIVLASVPAEAAPVRTITYPFIAGSFVIPMDAQQGDLLHAFGLVHAILRKGVPVYRVLTPPAVLLKTDVFAPPAPYEGGPFVVWGTNDREFADAAAAYPAVSYLRLSEVHILDRVLPIREPTDVLILKGGFNWGKTEVLLDQLGIPYNLRTTADVVADPGILFRYALVVDDCDGWAGRVPAGPVTRRQS